MKHYQVIESQQITRIWIIEAESTADAKLKWERRLDRDKADEEYSPRELESINLCQERDK